ncbi:sigma-54 interaction domain-containing protein [Salsuginibacillus kocurii]|uniref:sigma-54 interaction domain-containing protein n=1 Tax=Salsuginibacillus kocurii TaxID=427078 RepID=UPI000368E3C0|nr:sigma 54-interacting transcriptional regulator [Salsuginibacillus kocurii]
MTDKSLSEILNFEEIGRYIYDGIYITDKNGKTLYVNKSYERITGLKAEEVVGYHVVDLMERGVYKNGVASEVLKHKKQVNSVAEIRNGVTVLLTGNPIFNSNGDVEAVVIINRDMSDLLKIEKELNSTKEKMKIVEKEELKHKKNLENLQNYQTKNVFLGDSIKIKSIMEMIHHIADLDVAVLLTGETGVGKEVFSDEIYKYSHRNNQPFIKVNCAAIPGELLEAELFGYEKGAFTGASSKGRTGLFELANKGTILLDEIGEIPLELQSKLLRALQEMEITKVGGTESIKLDIRIIAATNANLLQLVKKGEFREDLYYRLNVFPLDIPPLRERREDIEPLTKKFLQDYNSKYKKNIELDQSGFYCWKKYAWPGNVRELKNVIERMVIISKKNAVIGEQEVKKIINIDMDETAVEEEGGLKEIVNNLERDLIKQALISEGSTRKAAKKLKIPQSTLVKKAKRLELNVH